MANEFHKKVKDVFLRAREISPEAAQKEFVVKSANGDADLEKEVFALLQNDTEETILSRDERPPVNAVIDPFGLEAVAKTAKPKRLNRILFSSRGRAGLALFVVALAIALMGIVAARNTKNALAEIRGQETEAILNSNIAALDIWISQFQSATEMILVDERVGIEINQLINGKADSTSAKTLDALLQNYLAQLDGHSYIITDLSGKVLLAPIEEFIGERVGERFGKEVYTVAGGRAQFILPFYPQESARQTVFYTEQPLVWMQVPVFDHVGNVVATFGVGQKADTDFTRILRTARMGETGETYAINKDAWFISESRFEDEMRKGGMLHNDTNVSSILNCQVRKQSYKNSQDIKELTDLANAVFVSANDSNASNSGVILTPSEDYLGAEVIGAWAWLPEYQFGIISQVDASEAFAPAKFIYRFIGAVVFLLILASFYSFYNAAQLLKVQGALSSAVQMGQYELKKLIEEGGMGAVYLAEHRLLKRPTAIKVIRVDKKDEILVKRFEREVHLASQLTHPNTVEIYDYGFTQDGQAYFAMEFIKGTNLSSEINKFGPMPPGRVVHIIRQVCGSLQEAHTMGMVHRDIKPQNIMLTDRIGLHDFVKVLDFGLAKPQFEPENVEETRAITGTPVYISPERLKRPGLSEPSADIYAVGALMYFLLSGKPIFSYSSDLDILYQVLNDDPKSLPKNVPEVLNRLTFFCLEKDPDNRPSSIEELKMFLDGMSIDFPWSASDKLA